MLGAGGSARAVAWALADAGAERVAVVNRTPERAVALAEDLGVDVDTTPAAGDLLVNCTSVGLEPTEDGQALEALGLGALEPPAVVVDLVYGDGPTPVERWAAAGGARFVGGTGDPGAAGRAQPGALDRPPGPGGRDARRTALKKRVHGTQPFVRAADTASMAVSRPFVLAVLGVLLAVATFASMRSAAERAQADDTAARARRCSRPPAPPSRDPAATTPAKPAPRPKPKPAKKKAAPAVKGVPPKVGQGARRTRAPWSCSSASPRPTTTPPRPPCAPCAASRACPCSRRPITKLARYRRVVTDLGVTQAPAVVIVGSDRKARLLEGFIDAGTLRQQVKDGR